MTVDLKRFTRRSPGELVATVGGENAFVPKLLPPEWVFPNELWPLLAEVKQQVSILEGVGRLLPNPGLLLRPLEDREAIQSSRLEGYPTAKSDVERLVKVGILAELANASPKTFYAPEIYDVAYRDLEETA